MNATMFLAIGVILLILVWAGGRRRGGESLLQGAMPDQSEYLLRLPPPQLLNRCFSEEDTRFAASLREPAVERLLLRERRRLALEWMRLSRREAQCLLSSHLRAVRFAADLRPAVEMKLLAQAGAFLITYQMLAVLLGLYGPLRTTAYVRTIQGMGNVLSMLGRAMAGSLPPESTSRLARATGD